MTLCLKAHFQLLAISSHLEKITARTFTSLQALVFTELLVRVAAITLARWKRRGHLPPHLLLLLHQMQAVIIISYMTICCFCFHLSCSFFWVSCSLHAIISVYRVEIKSRLHGTKIWSETSNFSEISFRCICVSVSHFDLYFMQSSIWMLAFSFSLHVAVVVFCY